MHRNQSKKIPQEREKNMSSEADKEYLKKHGIPALFNDITQELFRERPENPVQYLIELLKKKKAEKEAGASAPAAVAAAPATSEAPSTA